MIARRELREALDLFHFRRPPASGCQFAQRPRGQAKHRRDAQDRQLVEFACAQFAHGLRIHARLFHQLRVGQAEAALRFSDDVGEVIFQRNHGWSGRGKIDMEIVNAPPSEILKYSGNINHRNRLAELALH